MKIKLIHYPYNEHPVGKVVDFGDELNKSLVSLERAVWVGPPDKTPKFIKNVVTKKKMLTNNLREQVQEIKKEVKEEISATQKPLDKELNEGNVKEKSKQKPSIWHKWKSLTSTPAVLD